MTDRWLLDDVSALSDARKVESAEKDVSVRAFDKAVRRKPLAFAADAVGLWELHVVRQGRGGGRRERVVCWGGSGMLRGGGVSHDDGCEVTSGSGTRHTSTECGGAREVFEMG
jgi:hypothetical protein